MVHCILSFPYRIRFRIANLFLSYNFEHFSQTQPAFLIAQALCTPSDECDKFKCKVNWKMHELFIHNHRVHCKVCLSLIRILKNLLQNKNFAINCSFKLAIVMYYSHTKHDKNFKSSTKLSTQKPVVCMNRKCI